LPVWAGLRVAVQHADRLRVLVSRARAGRNCRGGPTAASPAVHGFRAGRFAVARAGELDHVDRDTGRGHLRCRCKEVCRLKSVRARIASVRSYRVVSVKKKRKEEGVCKSYWKAV